jgi:hypothetical protein
MKRSLFKEESELYKDIEQPILSTFNTITASRYVTNRHLEQISTNAISNVENLKSDYPHLYFITYMGGVFEHSKRLSNYKEFERRFSYFYRSMIDEILDLINALDATSYRIFLDRLLELAIKNAEAVYAPWPQLLLKLLPTIPVAQVDHVYQKLISSIEPSNCEASLALATSFVALLSGKEVSALGVLQKNRTSFSEQDVALHFQLLKKRARWRTMKQWLSVLFPHKKNGQYGSLQKFVDEMNTAMPMGSKEQKSIWNRWLITPNYQRYVTYARHLSNEQQLELIERLLPELEKRLHQLEAQKTYEKLLLAYQKFELASRYFLQYERDPTRLREEKIELLSALKEARPELARPIYHQFVVRLVEKKSRLHYEQAALYIKELQTLYSSTEEDQALFIDYIQKLKKMYRTYRAFVEELKQIDI